jgi:hypothetical protein
MTCSVIEITANMTNTHRIIGQISNINKSNNGQEKMITFQMTMCKESKAADLEYPFYPSTLSMLSGKSKI